ncbi:hypothetical protein GOODEAATRI_004021 [Goodea atripinnis]|uniref:Fibronectin type-III domain-containing protein n=1 Tax=Goodea atripinnis TaxID=208336 RepID=A0ABV0NRQ1_9TELE
MTVSFSQSTEICIRPVTHLYLSEGTSDSVLVAWSAPAPPADLFILSYSSADGTDTSKVTLDGSKTWSLVQDLLPSTHYMFSLITIQGDVSSEPITASLITGQVNSEMIDRDVTNYTLSSLFPATEYEISLNTVRGGEESKPVSTSVFTGRS